MLNQSQRPNWMAKILLGTAIAAVGAVAIAQEKKDWHEGLPKQHHSEYLVHDLKRPKPTTVTPAATIGQPPSDAIVLFDGKDLSHFVSTKGGGEAKWKVEHGYVEVTKTGGLRTKQQFGDMQLHVEFATPEQVTGESQGRGNSGVIIMDRYEVQVLDTFENETYADGYLGAIYGQHPPLVNAARKPGEWQSYDILFTRPRFNEKGEVVTPGYLTVMLNGIVVQNHTEIYGSVVWRKRAQYQAHGGKGPIQFQDHGNPLRFRNIWVRELE